MSWILCFSDYEYPSSYNEAIVIKPVAEDNVCYIWSTEDMINIKLWNRDFKISADSLTEWMLGKLSECKLNFKQKSAIFSKHFTSTRSNNTLCWGKYVLAFEFYCANHCYKNKTIFLEVPILIVLKYHLCIIS